MRVLSVLVLLAMAGPIPAQADSDVYQPPAAPGTVAVYRGSAGPAASGVTIHRGSAVRPAYLARASRAVPAAEALGGRNLWLVDRGEGTLASCRTVNTTVIGQRRIGCTSGRLPD